jgi:NAD(P)-dependent dehydrogenase (short-subunit alcohol dehydrogenase family)
MTDSQSFKGKTVLVTASTKGIGFAIVRRFAQQGQKITLIGAGR